MIRFINYFFSRWKFISIALLVIAAVSYATIDYKRLNNDEETKEFIRSVKVVIVNKDRNTTDISQSGEIKPKNEISLSFQVEGRLLNRKVNVGDFVNKGQFIASLDNEVLKNQLKIYDAELSSAKASLAFSREHAERTQRLIKSNAIAQTDADEAMAQLRTNEAKLDVAISNLKNAKLKLGYADLIASESGVVTTVGAQNGEIVSAGQMIIKVANTKEIDAVFDVSEAIYQNTPSDINVDVYLLANQSIHTLGKIREISPVLNAQSKTYQIKVALKNPPEEMTLGASVSGVAKVNTIPAIRLPLSALTSDGKYPAVFVVDKKSSTLKRVRIEVLKYTDIEIIVNKGLQDGQRVVVAGVSKLRPDQKVSVSGI